MVGVAEGIIWLRRQVGPWKGCLGLEAEGAHEMVPT